MADIKFDSTAFWKGFIVSLSAGLPPGDKEPTKADVEGFYGIKKNVIDKLFSKSERNYQEKFSNEEMSAFNAGTPPWNIRKKLISAALWKSKAAVDCKCLGVNLRDFVNAAEASLLPEASDLENWLLGSRATKELASNFFKSDFKEAVEKSVSSLASHFNGKITHSSAKSGAVLVTPDPEPLPYLYAGSLGEIGLVSIPLFSGRITAGTGGNTFLPSKMSQSLCFQGVLLRQAGAKHRRPGCVSIPLFSGRITAVSS